MHYTRMHTKGVLTARYQRPTGEGTLTGDGYIVFVRHVAGRKVRIRRCRLVMERHLGRELRPDETVHHKNGDRQDDRPKNLEVWTSRHPKGQRVEDLIEYAKWILATYG